MSRQTPIRNSFLAGSLLLALIYAGWLVASTPTSALTTAAALTETPTTPLTPTASLTLTPSPTATLMPSGVITLQHGVNGYLGGQDTYMEADSPDRGYYGLTWFAIGWKQKYAALLRFDLSMIPAGSVITSATLQFYAFGWSGGDIGIGAYAISRTVTLSETTWNQAQSGNLWGMPGCNDTSTDRRWNPESSLTTSGPTGWYSLDLTSLAQAWHNGAVPNNGVLLAATSSIGQDLYFASNEHSTYSWHPCLVIAYESSSGPTGTVTSTPTTTPSPTPTATPTLPGDMDGDCDVDIVDVMLVASRWGSSQGQPDYDARYDLDGNGEIDVADIMLVTAQWGTQCVPTPTPTSTPTHTATVTPTATEIATPTATPFAFMPMGSLAVVMGPYTCYSNKQCYDIEIQCPQLTQGITATVRVSEPTNAPEVGTVIFFAGWTGEYYFQDDGEAPRIVAGLRAAGYRAVEIKWGSSWYMPADYESAGFPRLACRAATVTQWVAETWHQPGQELPFCAFGYSNGAAEVALMLARYGLADILSAAMMVDGPNFVRLDAACLQDDPQYSALWYDGPGRCLVDCSFGYSICGQGPCYNKDTTWRTQFEDASVALGEWQYVYPHTVVHFVFGELDQGVTRAHGEYFYQKLVSVQTPFLLRQVVAGVGHSVFGTTVGADAIRDGLIADCHLH